jgi:hypothetical protein
MRRKDAMALKKGDVVWLKPFVRQTRTDDGLREFDHKQVEGKV